MSRLCFDYGHGGEDPGATYNGRKESNDVLSIGRAVATEVRRHGITVDETRTSDATVSLNDRSSFENRNSYDYFISFHRNAFKPEQARGVETYTYLNGGAKSKGLAQRVQTSLVALGFTDRGVKEADYHVLRETKAPAVLVEIGFIDNSGDNALFDSKRNEIIKAIAKAVLAQLGIAYIEPSAQASNGQTLYRVMAGSYGVRENAENQVQKLKAAGFDACIMIFNK
ncbi:N-acetylmuramoyl-L-alanine amidase [Clostridium botulinum]|uniref:N-acetylmuramoyl-L-alanine amidase n=1 Tax=Clostridium botulinum TaxID=1491 RepID=UPI0007743D15|nr:N-acetylmuramoyl-L-alanine amidase [Clostridium botulinum]NFL36773.1 N-acetylmuramoyl-L-alanine amidase [Clostridium botulinum]NFL64547.1 N-acetylmuramoyl-L-alanine amidase [Clostridium botulinum]NFN06673.1 N-acetylmuramoyl-L-alanine amidase [Clostridium botulinum]NFN23537.1 N-acetylmuramoyl-L-alanine amidase [Clostridium botulinum]NFN30177.1 N-acetylmuramoyl-L-alanine amidase [Clostridium botulinum]